MMHETTRRQVDHVLAGRTALGRPFGKPIAFAKDARAREFLDRRVEDFFFNRRMRLTDRMRTAYIRKLAVLIIRTQVPTLTSIWEANAWFHDHPEALLTRISLAGIRKRFRNEERHCDNAEKARTLNGMKAYMASHPERPCPVILKSGDYVLAELVHPLHLKRVGLEVDNCLAVDIGNEVLPNRHYFQGIRQGHRHIYKLTQNGKTCALFNVFKGVLTELHLYADIPTLPALFPRCRIAFEERIGPVGVSSMMIDCAPLEIANLLWAERSAKPISISPVDNERDAP